MNARFASDLTTSSATAANGRFVAVYKTPQTRHAPAAIRLVVQFLIIPSRQWAMALLEIGSTKLPPDSPATPYRAPKSADTSKTETHIAPPSRRPPPVHRNPHCQSDVSPSAPACRHG